MIREESWPSDICLLVRMGGMEYLVSETVGLGGVCYMARMDLTLDFIDSILNFSLMKTA
jgi:hypothetical protein